MKRFLLVVVSSVVLSASAAEPLTTPAQLFQHYLEERAWIASIIPPFDPALADKLQMLIAADDFSFQQQPGWYFPWDAAPAEFSGELAGYANFMIYEDLEKNELCLIADDKIIARGKTESFPSYAGLSGAAYEKAFLAELNRRSVVLRIPAQQEDNVWSSALALEEGGGYAMMSMGGQYEMEAVDLGVTDDGMAVTFAWPEGSFTNRLDIYAYDGETYNGLGSWKLADIGYSTVGTNQLVWVDTGQLGRGNPLASGIRLYAAGKGGDVDSDTDGYSDAYEHLVLNSDPNDGDTDNDGISDGPFDPDNTDPIVAGPDAFPLDPNEWLDTDGDGIGDNADTDADGDGILNGSDPAPLIPVTTAPFRVVTVEDTDPAGDDSGTEYFDVSSAGRMLPYASGANANSGYGSLHGGIYFNHDGTNLYIGVAGYEKGNDPNVLMLFLDTDGNTGGVTTLSGISGSPTVLGTADNLSFGSGFTPNVAVLVGGRDVDGRNDTNWQERGQGVYLLTTPTPSHFSGFSSTNGAISQWGDRGANSANAGIEVALSLSSLGLSVSNTFKAAAIVTGGGVSNPNNRHFSSEAYGASASGFGENATTLTGAPVYLSPALAPPPSGPPPFSEDDVMLQGYFWDVPGIISNMTVAGSFTGWNPGANNMTLTGHTQWEYVHNFATPTTNPKFKFAANGNWDLQWGNDTTTALSLPINYRQAYQGGVDIELAGTLTGFVRFRFNCSSARFTVESVASSAITGVVNTTTTFWYRNLATQAQTGGLDKFTMIWMPPPQKGNSGRQSGGYDPFDYYDLGSYNEKGSVPTRYGSEADLKSCVTALRGRGIRPIVDLVLNHNQNGQGGADKFRFIYGSHNTFEKLDPGGTNAYNYFNESTNNAPFHHEYDFGRDVNLEHPYQRQGLKAWGDWLTSKVGYQGYRWDLAFNMDPWFISEFMSSGLKKDRISILEYWEKESEGTTEEMVTWLALTDYRSAIFDMPLRDYLKDMCNLSGATFNMTNLIQKGLVNQAPQWAVTFAESHDTIRPYDLKVSITKDKMMAYAFVLMSAGLPMVPYTDYFVGKNADPAPPDDSVDDGWTGGTLKTEIDQLIDIRKTYAGGGTTYLYADSDLLIMKREGNEQKPGCILTLNDNDTTTKSASVNTGWPQGIVLVDALQPSHAVTVETGGMATLSASNRAYRIYIQQ